MDIRQVSLFFIAKEYDARYLIYLIANAADRRSRLFLER
jgi:hypothetical protein